MSRPIAVVLAAGKGTRMGSDLPKVMHPFLGEPMILHPLRAARAAGVERCVVVVGHGAASVRELVSGEFGTAIDFALQPEQRGTGDAVRCALPALRDHSGPVFVLSGDVPLLRSPTLDRLVSAFHGSPAELAMLTFRPEETSGYGRIVRDAAGRPAAIREHRDCSPAELGIDECNAGVYCVGAPVLRDELPRIGDANQQGEVYLTDLVERRATAGEVVTLEVDPLEVAGINTPEQLVALERAALARR